MPDLAETRLADALRVADPADPAASATSSRARADLARILATDPAVHPTTGPTRGTARTRLTGRLVLAGAAATAVLTGGVLAAPALTGGDAAYATWVATPTNDLSPAQRTAAADDCRASLADGAGAPPAGAEPAVVETRGVWTGVVLVGGGGSGLCITDSSARLFGDMIGSSGSRTPTPTGAGLTVTDLGTGTMSAGDLSLAAGLAGPEVAGIAWDSPSHGRVEATVAGGAFLLWAPGDDLGDGEPLPVLLTRTDGTTEPVLLTLG